MYTKVHIQYTTDYATHRQDRQFQRAADAEVVQRFLRSIANVLVTYHVDSGPTAIKHKTKSRYMI